MQGSKREIKEIKAVLKSASENGHVSKAEILDVMRRIRVILETEENGYATIKLYCDWMLHSKLDRSKKVEPILDMATAALHRHAVETDGISRSMSELLNLSTLRQELIALFKRLKLSPFLFTGLQNWGYFTGVILRDISERPIRLKEGAESDPNSSHGKIFRSMEDKYGLGMTIVRGFHVIWIDEEEAEPGLPVGFYWAIRLATSGGWVVSEENYAQIQGPLEFTEPKENFESD